MPTDRNRDGERKSWWQSFSYEAVLGPEGLPTFNSCLRLSQTLLLHGFCEGPGLSLCASKLQRFKYCRSHQGGGCRSQSLITITSRWSEFLTPLTNLGVVLLSCSLISLVYSQSWVHTKSSGTHTVTPHPLFHQQASHFPQDHCCPSALCNICPPRATDAPIQCTKGHQKDRKLETNHVEKLLQIFGGNQTLLLEECCRKVFLSSSHSCS